MQVTVEGLECGGGPCALASYDTDCIKTTAANDFDDGGGTSLGAAGRWDGKGFVWPTEGPVAKILQKTGRRDGYISLAE